MESSQDSLDSSLGKFSPLSILSSNQTPSKPNLFGSQNRIAFSVNALSLTLAETLVQNSVFSTPTTNPQTIQDIYASLPDLLLYAHLIPLCILSVKKLPSFSEESSK